MKLFLLSKVLDCISITEPGALESIAKSLQYEESAWIEGSLSESYENEILLSIGLPSRGKTLTEYGRAFLRLGLDDEDRDRRWDMAEFKGVEELRSWVKNIVKTDLLTEQYLEAMLQKRGWEDWGGANNSLSYKDVDRSCQKALFSHNQ